MAHFGSIWSLLEQKPSDSDEMLIRSSGVRVAEQPG